ncbi:hypothetical protein JD844_019107 [Phrynosoma platyrhinos]|uniref:RING-type E3 ubiquitin transferase n=1 Tax=Phrynosoma platyrhinos TaxID=52577 RepID=A0ABQ7SPH1_PHRPL|nr:hypothetical protein JD844_019107 [Phrynosoma platyrhinos]
MQATNVREDFIASSARLVADVLTSLLSGNWEMGDSFSWEETPNREGNASSEGSSPPGETRARRVRLSQSNMRSEEKRLRTFQHWADRAPVSPADLAAAGFFFVGPDDRVECFCCGGVLYDWFAEDDPMVEHEKFFPTCPFIQGRDVGNQPLLQVEEIQDCVDGQFLGMLQSLNVEEAPVDGQPEYPDMEVEEDRLATYRRWPSYARVSPEMLATAGFFYTESAQRELDPSRREIEMEYPNATESTLSIEEKLRRLQEERMCKVCMDKDERISF